MNDLGLGIIVSLKDAFTQNATRVQSSMQSLDASVEAAGLNMTRNLGLIEKGTTMVGAGLALLAIPTGLVASTVATQTALGELASVGVKDFRAMEDAAESFTNQWAGTNKAEFITAAYDVKSALANLSDQAVGTFAAMAALTAKATKATTQEMVETFTTAYGIFKPLAKDMSDIEWAKMFSGALSQTVGVFKTTGPQMAEAIKNIGAIAAASNVPLQEQMAILGQLQTTMPGSEAGTLYKAFMLKVAEAGDELGLSFVDTSGRLKGILPILQEVKRGFPDLSQAAAQVKLKKAFGSDEAVRFLLQMSMGMDQLEGNIKSVEQAMKSGTVTTEQMAKAMNQDIGSQYGLVKQQLTNLFEILGRTMLPVVIPLFQMFSRFILHLQSMAKSMPDITRKVLTLCAALGAILVVVGAVVSAIGTIGIVLPALKAGLVAMGPMLAGVGSTVSAYFWPVVAVIAAVVIAVVLLKRAWETNFAGIRDVVMGAWNRTKLAFQGVWALISSIRGGSGQMSAELAQKLQAAGLMKFVTTVFQVYYRVRQFLSGLWQAFSSVFDKIRSILEPAVRALMGAFGELGKALGSIFAAFGLATTAVDASSFKSFGQTLGTVLGIIAQVAAYIIKFIVYPLSWVIRIIAAVVQAAVWFGKVIITAFVAAAPYVYRFYLPLRMLIQALLTVGRVAYTVWRMITGDISVVDGLKTIGSAIFGFLSTPFLWIRDIASSTWNWLRNLFSGFGGFFRSAGTTLLSAFQSLPVVTTISKVLSTIRSLVSGRINLTEAGKQILITLGRGIWSAVIYPFDVMKRALGWLRRLLPFSDAQEGPLSTLTASGAAILRTLAQGMLSLISLPGQVLSTVFRSMLNATNWVWDEMRALGAGLVSTVSSAFSQIGSIAGSTWSRVRGSAASAWSSITLMASNAAGWLRAPFTALASGASSAWSVVRGAASNAFSYILSSSSSLISSAFQSGRSVMTTIASGIRSAVAAPYEAARSALSRLRRLLPFSDAQEGPLSTLTRSGAAMLEAFSAGITRASELPARALHRSLGTARNLMSVGLPTSALAATLALTPVVAGAVPGIAPVEHVGQTVERSRLLAVTRGTLASEQIAGVTARSEELRPLLEAILVKLDGLSDRPIEVDVTTKLDGRQIARAVYKDMREQKIKNYETM
ncbi:phage tail tape measure protein [bacterium]|nr:phage tail tape measure protein [bacterium]